MNLRDDIYENMISRKVRKDIWIPEIGFFNARTGSVKNDPFTAFMIRRDSESDMPDFARPKEDYVFDGYGNALMLLRR